MNDLKLPIQRSDKSDLTDSIHFGKWLCIDPEPDTNNKFL